MNYNIKFEKGTLEDFKDAIDYYEGISGNLADKFHNEFWNKIDYIKGNPLHFQTKYRGIRIAHLKTFSFGIHFIIDEITITVFKILHHKQYYK
ncbi:MAG: type II toxin-antitoxin system RelE/ParE family toxin [Flavobacteriaceae bacterium]|nr:type II toxin-antitoxin system RelE/ParE family toxin [Flavobacteriaceae bacterium]